MHSSTFRCKNDVSNELNFLSAISINILDIKIKKSNKSISLLPFLIIFLLPISLYSSARIYNSSIQGNSI